MRDRVARPDKIDAVIYKKVKHRYQKVFTERLIIHGGRKGMMALRYIATSGSSTYYSRGYTGQSSVKIRETGDSYSLLPLPLHLLFFFFSFHRRMSACNYLGQMESTREAETLCAALDAWYVATSDAYVPRYTLLRRHVDVCTKECVLWATAKEREKEADEV